MPKNSIKTNNRGNIIKYYIHAKTPVIKNKYKKFKKTLVRNLEHALMC